MHYVLHFLSKVERLGDHTQTENADFYQVEGPPTRRPSFWIQEKLAKIQSILLSNAFCAKCVVRLDNTEDILAHLKKRHANCLLADYAVEGSNRRAKKIKQKERRRCRNIHHANHQGCLDCDFDTASEDEV